MDETRIMKNKQDRSKKFPRLSSKLRRSTTLVIALIVIGSSLVSLLLSIAIFRKGEIREQEINAQAVNIEIADFLDKALTNLDMMAISAAPFMQADFDMQRSLLQQLRTLSSDIFEELTLIDMSGREKARDSSYHSYTKNEMGIRLADPVYQSALRGESTIAGQTSMTPFGALPVIPMAVPIYSELDELAGVLFAEVSIKPIWDILAKTKVDETGYAYLVDSRGVLLAHHSMDQYNQFVNSDLTTSPAVLYARTGGKGSLPDVYQGLNGQKVLGVVSPLSGLGWYLIFELPLGDIFYNMSTFLYVWGIMLLVTIIIAVAASFWISRIVLAPLNQLSEGAAILGRGQLDYEVQVSTDDEVSQVADELNSMARKLRDSYDDMENRVSERTIELQQRSAFLEAAAEVGRAATTFLESDQLIRQIVSLIRERFGLYYVGLFLLDDEAEWAVLKAGTGNAGQAMLRRGHRIKVGSGMVGWSIQAGKPRVAQDIDVETQRLVTAELPNTRSEAALPLRSRGQVLGALSVQSEQPEAFSQDVVNVLQTMVDQVAVAIDNARLFAERQRAIDISRQAYGEISREAWNKLLHLRRSWGYRFSGNVVMPARGEWRPEMVEAIHTETSVQAEEDDASFLAVPLKVRGKIVGVFNLQKDRSDNHWTKEDISMVQNIIEQIGQAVESARLFQNSQERAFHEQLVTEITTQMRQSLDVETVLKTAVSEIREALGLEEVIITFGDTNG